MWNTNEREKSVGDLRVIYITAFQMIQAWIFVETLFIPSQSKKVYTLGYDFRKPLWKLFKEIIFIIVFIFFR